MSAGSFPERGSRELADLAATRALGAELGTVLGAGDVVVLTGPLGAGKTSLTQGLAEALGVRGRITSPTFQLARRHGPASPGGTGLVHVDAYRLRGEGLEEAGGEGEDGHDAGGPAPAAASGPDPHALADELESLDLDAFLDTDVVVVEWGEGLAEVLSESPWIVRLSRDDVADTRSARWERIARVRDDRDDSGSPSGASSL